MLSACLHALAVVTPARGMGVAGRAGRVVAAVEWQRGGRGEEHLSAFVAEGDVLVYQVGTWLVDAVPVGDGTPARYRLARADGVQIVWTHACEHGVLRGHELRWLGAGPAAGAEASLYAAAVDSEGWPVDCEFGPEQLVARLQEGDALPAEVLTMLDPAAVAVPRQRPPTRRTGDARMGLGVPHQPRLLVAGLSEEEAAVVVEAAAEVGWSLEAEAVTHTSARLALFVGLAGAGGAEEEEASEEVSEACEYLVRCVSEALDCFGAERVVVSATSATPSAAAAQPELAAAVNAARDRHAADYGLRVPLAPAPARTGGGGWRASEAVRVLHAGLDGGEVSFGVDSWWDVSEVVALDGLVDETLRHALLEALGAEALGLGAGGWDPERGADPRVWERGCFSDVPQGQGEEDQVGAARPMSAAGGLGLCPEALARLCDEEDPPPAVVELQARIAVYLCAANPSATADAGATAATAARTALSLPGEAEGETLGDLDGLFAESSKGLGAPRPKEEWAAPQPPHGVTSDGVVSNGDGGTALRQYEGGPSAGSGVEVCRMSDACFAGGITQLAANAPTAADGAAAFGWHVDADPLLLPPSPWTDAYRRYPNRLPGKPRFVTALVYLSPEWRPEWGAPTRFLDTPTGEVLSVAPAPGRVCLMDQDLSHSVTAPEESAGERPRYSLALKLVVHPTQEERVRLTPAGWGEPLLFGSAAGGILIGGA